MDKKVIDIKQDGKTKKPRINWLQIRTEYETTGMTLLELSKKYGASYDRTKHKAMEEKWSRYKTEAQNQIREEIKARAIDSNLINSEYILTELKKIAEDKEVLTSNKLKALELLGKSIGIFKDTVNINNGEDVKKLEDIILENQL